jgi:glutamine amidotransferase
MCLLVAIPASEDIAYGRAVEAAANNPDGFGFAIIAETHIVRFRSMSFDETWSEWQLARSRWDGPAVWHWRWATGGTMDVANCHPFEVGGDSRLMLAHNGVLPIAATRFRSDTRILAEDVLADEDVTLWDDDGWRDELGAYIGGNKLVFLSVHPDQAQNLYIVNERHGHWDAGVWWSNTSYVPAPKFRFADSPLASATVDLDHDDCIEIVCDTCRGVVVWSDEGDDDCPWCDSCLVCGDDCLCSGSPSRSWQWDDAEV